MTGAPYAKSMASAEAVVTLEERQREIAAHRSVVEGALERMAVPDAARLAQAVTYALDVAGYSITKREPK